MCVVAKIRPKLSFFVYSIEYIPSVVCVVGFLRNQLQALFDLIAYKENLIRTIRITYNVQNFCSVSEEQS